MNPNLKRARSLHATELAEALRAWEEAWRDYAGAAGRAMRERIGDDRARRAHALLVRLANATEEEGEAVRIIAERKAAEVRATGAGVSLAEWGAYVEAFELATVAFVLHFGTGEPPDLSRWPDDIPIPPENPEPFVAACVAAFDAAENDAEALAHVLRIACEFLYLWQRRASTLN